MGSGAKARKAVVLMANEMTREHSDVWGSFWTRKPRCPHCNGEIAAPWELNLIGGTSTGMWCGWCDKTMEISCKVTVEYRTEKG